MRKQHLIFTFFILFILSSCNFGDDKVKSIGTPPSGNGPLIFDPLKHKFQGDWQSRCYYYHNEDQSAYINFRFSKAQIKCNTNEQFVVGFYNFFEIKEVLSMVV